MLNKSNKRLSESVSLQAFANKHASVSLEWLTVNCGITSRKKGFGRKY